jgi:hypothetical protein
MKTIYILLIALLVTTCDSDDTVDPASLLPPITMTGENTFGCLIDGKFFRPRDGRSTINSDNKGLRVVQTETDNWEIHVFDRKSEKSGSLILHLENLENLELGNYIVSESNGLRGIDGNNNNYIHANFYKNGQYNNYLSFYNSGNVVISKKDYSPNNYHIFSGTFQVKLVNIHNTQDTLNISLGRFDLELGTVQQTSFN